MMQTIKIIFRSSIKSSRTRSKSSRKKKKLIKWKRKWGKWKRKWGKWKKKQDFWRPERTYKRSNQPGRYVGRLQMVIGSFISALGVNWQVFIVLRRTHIVVQRIKKFPQIDQNVKVVPFTFFWFLTISKNFKNFWKYCAQFNAIARCNSVHFRLINRLKSSISNKFFFDFFKKIYIFKMTNIN